MTAIAVATFFVGCIVGAAITHWYKSRPSKFDRWREQEYKKYQKEQ